ASMLQPRRKSCASGGCAGPQRCDERASRAPFVRVASAERVMFTNGEPGPGSPGAKGAPDVVDDGANRTGRESAPHEGQEQGGIGTRQNLLIDEMGHDPLP